jgi:hypothetical protein
MNARAFFESLWSEPVTAEQEHPPLCRFATQFQGWAEELLSDTLHVPTIVKINQAKILLLDKYFEWRTVAPRGHRDKVSNTGHICIWHVFFAAYNRLREAELGLTPPQVVEPMPPASAGSQALLPARQVSGIFLAEEDE